MQMLNQVKLSIFIGMFSAVILFVGGIFLPLIISSKLPLALIIIIPILYLIGLYISILGLIKLFKLKNILNNSKRKCHEKQRKTKSTIKSKTENKS
jgi:ABC-type multidrug transport system fused ATPase/permease subunit